MAHRAERTAAEWFAAAARCHVEGHQGCIYCGGKHCVFRNVQYGRVEYYCSNCDFSACHDRRTGQYLALPGEHNEVPDIVLDVEVMSHKW
jgi:hypothetical protein